MKLIALSTVSQKAIENQNSTAIVSTDLIQQMDDIKDMTTIEIAELFQAVDSTLLKELYSRLYLSKEADNISKMVSSYLSVQKVLLDRSQFMPEMKMAAEIKDQWSEFFDHLIELGPVPKDELMDIANGFDLVGHGPGQVISISVLCRTINASCIIKENRRGGKGQQVKYMTIYNTR